MSRNFIDKGLPLLAMLASMMLVSCASAPDIQESGAEDIAIQLPPSSRELRDYEAALRALEAGDDVDAISRFEAFIAQSPRWAGAYVNLAILYEQHGRADEALELLNQAIFVDPTFVAAYNQLGVIQRGKGNFAAAEQSWLAATQINPDYAFAWYNLGVLYELYVQDLSRALDSFRRYQELVGQSGGDPQVAAWISDLERRIGQPGQAASARKPL